MMARRLGLDLAKNLMMDSPKDLHLQIRKSTNLHLQIPKHLVIAKRLNLMMDSPKGLHLQKDSMIYLTKDFAKRLSLMTMKHSGLHLQIYLQKVNLID
jgi:hypothetical protein